MSDTARSFAPVARRDARVLILGSMPGRASLEAQRYYAYRHNHFWPIMAELLGFDLSLSYARRCLALRRAGVALWDVLQSCERAGSLDSSIVESSIVPNDFAGWLARHPGVGHVFLNGGKADDSYRRYVLPTLAERYKALPRTRLPSTSPAHASVTLAQKKRAWRAVLRALAQD